MNLPARPAVADPVDDYAIVAAQPSLVGPGDPVAVAHLDGDAITDTQPVERRVVAHVHEPTEKPIIRNEGHAEPDLLGHVLRPDRYAAPPGHERSAREHRP